jgi:hypothetical protein
MSWIPADSGEIDAARLTDALSARYPGVRVAAVECAHESELTNHHARLEIAYHARAGAPATVFCKLLPRDPARRAAVAATGMGPREAHFYSRLAAGLSMRVPEAYVAVADDRDGSFFLLLEDLDASGCAFSDGTTGVSCDAAARALEDLAALHVRFADPVRRRTEAGWVPPPLHDPSYGRALLRIGLEQHPERLSPEFAAIASRYIDRPDAMHASWQQGPTTVIHGDPHIGNLFDDRGRVGFLDWGIISTGTPLRDVSYFLCMALSIEDRRRHERSLLRHCLEIWNAGTRERIDFDEAWHVHRVHAAYTVLACCQIVTFPPRQPAAQRTFSEAFLARATAAVADLDALSVL